MYTLSIEQVSGEMTGRIKFGVPQGNGLDPDTVLHYTADLPTTANTTTATFADNTAVLAVCNDP